MPDIADDGVSDHLSETGEVVSITAPIKVAPIKSIFRIVVLLSARTCDLKSQRINRDFD
jgi:hypothetical protein